MLEGLALYADPNFKVLAASYPYFAKRLLTDSSPYLRDALIELLFKDGKFRYELMWNEIWIIANLNYVFLSALFRAWLVSLCLYHHVVMLLFPSVKISFCIWNQKLSLQFYLIFVSKF